MSQTAREIRHDQQEEVMKKGNAMRIRSLAAGAVLVLMSITSASTSNANGGFSTRTLRGVYGFSGSGSLGGGTIPAAVVGLNWFDRAGGCRISGRLNTGTQIDPLGKVQILESQSCTYKVNADGTGSLDVTFGPPFEVVLFHSDFVIVDDARQLQFVLSDQFGATIASGVSTKQAGER